MTLGFDRLPAKAGRSLVLALAVALTASASNAQPEPHLGRGTPAPELTVERLMGGALQLSTLRGRVVVLDFWATWCPPCRAELPWLLRLAQRDASRGLVFVAVNQDQDDQRRLATQFSQELPGIERYIAFGGARVGAIFHVDGLPTLYVLDRQGRVFASAEGRLTEAEVTAIVEQALAQ